MIHIFFSKYLEFFQLQNKHNIIGKLQNTFASPNVNEVISKIPERRQHYRTNDPVSSTNKLQGEVGRKEEDAGEAVYPWLWQHRPQKPKAKGECHTDQCACCG